MSSSLGRSLSKYICSMGEKISRRKFGALALGAAVGAPAFARTPPHNAQGALDPPSEQIDAVVAGDMASLERKLAKPLSAEARKLTISQLKNNKGALKDRYKFDLPENSEPCFIYPPTRQLGGHAKKIAP